MVKTQTHRRQRLELRKQFRESDVCPHCGKRVQNLEDHIKREHGFRCDLCSKIFGKRQQWMNHMRDFHMQNEKEAETTSKVSKIETWLRKKVSKGKKVQAAAKENEDPEVQGDAVSVVVGGIPTGKMEADSDGEDEKKPERCRGFGGGAAPVSSSPDSLGFGDSGVGATTAQSFPAPTVSAFPAPAGGALNGNSAPVLSAFKPASIGFGAPGAAASASSAPPPAAAPASAAPLPFAPVSFSFSFSGGSGASAPPAPPYAASASPSGFGPLPPQGTALFSNLGAPAPVTIGFGALQRPAPAAPAFGSAPPASMPIFGTSAAAAAACDLAAAVSVPIMDDDEDI